jgi:hypothetical protein
MTETLGRISGELTSAGFATEIIDEPKTDDVPPGQSSRAWLEQLATRRGFDAVVAIVGNASPDSVEVWVVDKITKKSVVRTVHLGPADERMPKTLSVRAIELLRSSFLEIDLAATERVSGQLAAPPVVVQFVARGRAGTRPGRCGLELGGIAVKSLGGPGPALLPVVGFDFALGSSFGAQVTLAGLGTRPTVANQEGSAQIAQGFGLLGARYSFGASRVLRPFVTFSAGLLHTAVDGRTQVPLNQEWQVDKWSLLLDAGGGTWLWLREHLFVSTSMHVQLAEPRLAIRFVDQVVARTAGPNLLLIVAVGAVL